jgi:hypothetical protein
MKYEMKAKLALVHRRYSESATLAVTTGGSALCR